MRKEYHTKKGLFVAANGVSLEVQPNSLVALLGPSGSGPCAAAPFQHICFCKEQRDCNVIWHHLHDDSNLSAAAVARECLVAVRAKACGADVARCAATGTPRRSLGSTKGNADGSTGKMRVQAKRRCSDSSRGLRSRRTGKSSSEVSAYEPLSISERLVPSTYLVPSTKLTWRLGIGGCDAAPPSHPDRDCAGVQTWTRRTCRSRTGRLGSCSRATRCSTT
jgi:hypothetical protein